MKRTTMETKVRRGFEEKTSMLVGEKNGHALASSPKLAPCREQSIIDLEDLYIQADFEQSLKLSREYLEAQTQYGNDTIYVDHHDMAMEKKNGEVMPQIEEEILDGPPSFTTEIALHDVTASPLLIQKKELVTVLCIYFDSMYELEAREELKEASRILNRFTPLPFDLGIKWIKLLVAFGIIQDSDAMLRQLRERLRIAITVLKDTSTDDDQVKYTTVIDLIVFDIMQHSCSSDDIINEIQSDVILGSEIKNQYVTTISSLYHNDQDSENHSHALPEPVEEPQDEEPSPLKAKETNVVLHPSTIDAPSPNADEKHSIDYTTGILVSVAIIGVMGAYRYRKQLSSSAHQAASACFALFTRSHSS